MTRTRNVATLLTILVLFLCSAGAQPQISNQLKSSLLKCDENNFGFCTELRHDKQFNGHYSGHDEPSVIFYSDRPGAGNNALYHVTLPLDPPVAPRQDGSGGTFNFQLHTASWFGMVLCDTQSSPNFTHVCVPDTDANVFDNPDPNAKDFIGHHPGSAFLELQFYPPGGVNTCSDPVKWCVAMVIFSFNIQDLTGAVNNLDCQQRVGLEPSNFAFLTNNGVAQSPADPLNNDINKFSIFPGTTFQMDPGDQITVEIHDSAAGLQVVIHDLTAGTTGSMTASTANGFAQVNFDPDTDPAHPKTCSSSPYAFHPMFSTSSEHTRSTWTAHTYNVAFSDEIGHYELCNAVDVEGGNCIQPGADDPQGLDDDDTGCFTGDFLALFGLQPIGTCINGDFDFDGASYQFRWPGTGNAKTDARLKPTPLRFTSPQFVKQGGDDRNGELHDYDRIGFEADMPGIEFESNPACDVFNGGQGCTNPPAGAAFYPIFSTIKLDNTCQWQFGGPKIPGAINTFGGTSTTEFGPISGVAFPNVATPEQPNGSSIVIFGNYRRILNENPCRNGN